MRSLSRPLLNATRFESARFVEADFRGVRFTGPVSFDDALFETRATFRGATFEGIASFAGARCAGEVSFRQVSFGGGTSFSRAEFGELCLRHAHVGSTAEFDHTRAAVPSLDGARFRTHVSVRGQVSELSCNRTRFDEGAVLTLDRGTIVAEGTGFGAPSTISAASDEHDLPRLVSLRGTDLSNLVLTDVDLTECRFAGAHRLDQLRVEGRLRFGVPEGRWRTRRHLLAEETTWRRGPFGSVGPAQVAALYRSLRKAFEDGKNEAGARGLLLRRDGDAAPRRRDPAGGAVDPVVVLAAVRLRATGWRWPRWWC